MLLLWAKLACEASGAEVICPHNLTSINYTLSYEYLNNCSTIDMNALDMQRPLDAETANRLAEMFAVLSDPTRLRILSALSHHNLNVGELADLIGMSESAISHQLRLLRT